MMRGHIVDKINEIDDKLFFLREKINRSISDLNTRAVHEASKSIISLILRREDLMTQEDSHQEKTIENHIENDKVEIELAYNEGNLGKAHHLEDQLASLERYHTAHPEDHHDPSDFELYCEDNPSAVECKIHDN
jgi:hypothetical protein